MAQQPHVINSVNRLRLKYPEDDALVFKGISLSIRKGEKILLVGPSGCGKSTLLQVLSGLAPDAVPLPMKVDERIIPQRWAFVFQDPDTQFCMPYIDEELAFALENQGVPREEMPEQIKRYLTLVGLNAHQPHTLIQSLSQGMKQRLAIASALALRPEVLYLDEPTALLDPEGTRLVWETIKALPSDITLVIVEHNIEEMLSLVDRVVLMSDSGEVEADEEAGVFFNLYGRKIADCGIWYPGIWSSYSSPANTEAAQPASQPIMQLESLRGLRGGKPKVTVDHATVQHGDWVSIIGENGAGKSTLLLSIMRLIETEGQIRFRGVEQASTKQIAKDVGFVFQNPELQFITDSVFDELQFSSVAGQQDYGAARAAAEQMLIRLGLEHCRDHHPYQLSMGQKRRLSVATALMGGKKLLFLDEPTFGLDAISAFRVLELLEELRADGTAILMVTHDMEIVKRFSTKIWRIDKGIMKEEPF